MRVLVVGVGSIGERHVRCFQATGRVQLGICEVNAALRETVAARYGIHDRYEDVGVALAGGYEAVVICVPAHLHIPIALQSVQAGCHVLIEKPLSTTTEGVGRLESEVAGRRVIAAVAYVYRAHPVLTAMKQALDSGRFGRPLQLTACSGQHFPKYRPAYRDIYYADRASGGGAIQDALTHVINASQWLVGPTTRLAADAEHLALDGVSVEDTVHVLARHGDVLASYSLNQHQAPNESTITVVCERGTLRFEYHENRWRWMTEPGGAWHDQSIGTLPRDELFVRQANAFLDAVQQQSPPLCSLADAQHTLHTNLAILAAADSHQWQEVECRG